MLFAPLLVAVALAGAPIGTASIGTAPPAGVPMAAPVTCDISDATLSWGFKESFRAYIDGDIANGSWTEDGNASYETPSFTWSGGTGTYTPLYDRTEIAFTGSVRFVGHDGLLDTTIANPVIRIDGSSGTMKLDVSGPTMDGDPVSLQGVSFVELAAADVVGDDAVRTVDADTALTADGATAFPNYEAGTPFDPASISMTVGKLCPTAAVVDDVETSSAPSPLAIGLGGFAALAVAAIVLVIVLTRRRRA